MDYFFPRMTRAVKVVLIVHAAVFVLSLFIAEIPRMLALYLQRDPAANLQLIYRIFTYTTAEYASSIVNLLLFGLFMWWMGCNLEEKWGTRTFVAYLLTTVAVSGLLSLMVLSLFRLPIAITGTSGLTFAIIAIVAFDHPNLPIYIFGIFPIKAKWVLLFSLLVPALASLTDPSFVSLIYLMTVLLANALVAIVFVMIRFPLPVWLGSLGLFRDRSGEIPRSRFHDRSRRPDRNRNSRISKFPLSGVWDKDRKKIKELIDEIHADANKQKKDDDHSR